MSKLTIKIRKMTRADIPAAMRLKEAEKWNQTLKDWDILLASDDHVNFVAEMDDKIVGSVTAINYDNDVAWIGMMIVDQNYRGLGISRDLMRTAIEKLKINGCRCIKLDATPAGQPVYKKLGFIDEYTLVRMTNPAMDTSRLDSFNVSLTPVRPDHIDALIGMDKRVFGARREILIRRLISDYPDKARVLVREGKLNGFVLGRDGMRFNQIGPVSARDPQDVMGLIADRAIDLRGQPVVVDVLEEREELIAWLGSLGFVSQRPFYRMYLEHNPFPGNYEHQFLICGPEFG